MFPMSLDGVIRDKVSHALSSFSQFVLMSSGGSSKDKIGALEHKLAEAEADLKAAKAANDKDLIISYNSVVASIHNDIASLRQEAPGKFGSILRFRFLFYYQAYLLMIYYCLLFGILYQTQCQTKIVGF